MPMVPQPLANAILNFGCRDRALVKSARPSDFLSFPDYCIGTVDDGEPSETRLPERTLELNDMTWAPPARVMPVALPVTTLLASRRDMLPPLALMPLPPLPTICDLSIVPLSVLPLTASMPSLMLP